MYQNDYIIAFDENGKPYIAHSAVGNAVNRVASAVKNARGDRQNHKYILKIDENGRKRYFYTQDEVKAYYEEKRKQAAGAVDKAKEGVKNAGRAAKQAIENASGVTAKRNAEASSAAAVQAKRDSAKADSVVSENRRAYTANKSPENLKRLQDSEKGAAKDFERAVNASLSSAIDKRTYRNTPLGRAESEAKAAKELASMVYDKAKDSASNTVTNAKNRFERMKSEFRDKAEQTKDNVSKFTRDASSAVREGTKEVAQDRLKAAREEYAKTKDQVGSAKSSAQDMIDRARTAIKDKAEDLSAKAKSTAQSVMESAQGMIENARSSTAKAVNEAWDKIPKNADGTVNPFDSNFQSAYNDWKSKKDKYDGSLTGQAKAAAEKATDSVKDMIDTARKAVTSSNSSANAARKAFKEYSENDSDFDEKNYSKENRVEDTDFYTFKRNDGKSVVLEEDMKWVLPRGVDASNPTIKSALKQIANSGRFKSYDDWLENANDILGEAIEKVRDKEK